MPITCIRSIRNQTGDGVQVRNLENPADTGGRGSALRIAPGQVVQCNMWIPWADNEGAFENGSNPFQGPAHIDFIFPWFSGGGGLPPHEIALWQSGDYVRRSLDLSWITDGPFVQGLSVVGGDRSVDIIGAHAHEAELMFY
jgi:hypothetical protein